MKNKKKRRLFKVKYTNYFEPKKYIITFTELKFYKKFFEIAERLNLILLTKVSIHQLVSIKDTLYKPMALKQCGTECIDFMFADKETCKILLSIRLQDPYMNEKKKKSERFITELCDELNINLIKMKITEDFNEIYLENQLSEIMAHINA